MNSITYNDQYINHRQRVYCCISCVLLFQLFTIVLLLVGASNFSWNPPQSIFTSMSIGKCHASLKIHPIQFVLDPLYSWKFNVLLLCFLYQNTRNLALQVSVMLCIKFNNVFFNAVLNPPPINKSEFESVYKQYYTVRVSVVCNLYPFQYFPFNPSIYGLP